MDPLRVTFIFCFLPRCVDRLYAVVIEGLSYLCCNRGKLCIIRARFKHFDGLTELQNAFFQGDVDRVKMLHFWRTIAIYLTKNDKENREMY